MKKHKPNHTPNFRLLLRTATVCSIGVLLLASATFHQAQAGMFDSVLDGFKKIGEGAGEVLDGTGKAIGRAMEKQLGDGDQDQSGQSQGFLGKVFAAARNTDLGPRDKYELGRELSARVLGKYDALPQHRQLVGYVRKVLHALLPQSRNPTQYAGYTVIVLTDKELINAFAAPGGIVFVSTGMLKSLESEDELATILGHELAHQELLHGLNSIKDAEAQKLFKTAVGDDLGDAFGPLMQSMENGYGSTMEAEADLRGMEIAKAAGYDPAALVTAIRRLMKSGRGKSEKYPADRLRLAQQHLQTIGSGERSHKKVRTTRYLQAKAQIK